MYVRLCACLCERCEEGGRCGEGVGVSIVHTFAFSPARGGREGVESGMCTSILTPPPVNPSCAEGQDAFDAAVCECVGESVRVFLAIPSSISSYPLPKLAPRRYVQASGRPSERRRVVMVRA